MEEQIKKNVKLTEVEVADKLLEFRSAQPGFLDTSFDTISGTCQTFIVFYLFLQFFGIFTFITVDKHVLIPKLKLITWMFSFCFFSLLSFSYFLSQ